MDLGPVVLDIASFESIESLKQTYLDTALTPGRAALLIVDTIEQETAILEWLSPEHEICTRDEARLQLDLRIKRCVSRNSAHEIKDPLTGLSNRKALKDYAAMFRASHNIESPLCAIFLELDRFKEINDKYGHVAGDQVLAEIGRILRRLAFGAGAVARLGGDDFVVVMPGDLDQGWAFAELLRGEIEVHPFTTSGDVKLSLTCSAGVASADGSLSFEDLLKLAEQCVYTAKREGRNLVVTASRFDSLVDAGEDALIADFENRIRVTAERLTGELVLNARKMAGEYRAEAVHDGLTGIFNRRYLDRLLPRELEKSRLEEKPLSIALLDLDHFRELNTTYGYPTADRALKAAAAVIQRSVRAGDWVARYGGDEFCVVFTDTDLNTSAQVAERIRQALSAESITAYDGQSLQISASIGVVQLELGDRDAEALLQRASDKVSEAKKTGRNQVRL